ncbi:uncharacterized protein LOC107870688 [Capsicum annuum]|uniref:uncharacterized protein LOC107870688 n=1 Tax=Capsicum annuum TaxID=4072 RepID=UPI001FB0C7B5|nr:uncharacterized protein LOC107870688 [Capsicum annuum]
MEEQKSEKYFWLLLLRKFSSREILHQKSSHCLLSSREILHQKSSHSLLGLLTVNIFKGIVLEAKTCVGSFAHGEQDAKSFASKKNSNLLVKNDNFIRGIFYLQHDNCNHVGTKSIVRHIRQGYLKIPPLLHPTNLIESRASRDQASSPLIETVASPSSLSLAPIEDEAPIILLARLLTLQSLCTQQDKKNGSVLQLLARTDVGPQWDIMHQNMQQGGKFSIKSDIFSFGVLLLEIKATKQ